MNDLFRATWVIARRDFTALILSKAFLIFLVVPLLFAAVIGGVSLLEGNTSKATEEPVIGLNLAHADADRLIEKRNELQRLSGIGLPRLASAHCRRADCSDALDRHAAMLSGSIDRPVLIATAEDADHWRGRITLILHAARQRDTTRDPALTVRAIAGSPDQPDTQDRTATAQAGQAAIFLLTLLLGGMAISNLVEEKTNKIIEILAASISMDAVFLGKLLAMLGIALVAIAVWGVAGGVAELVFGLPLPELAQPAVGWPIFLLLGIAYFTTSFLLFGTLLLGVGSLANTVREVQTLSLPISLAQMLIFFLASYAVNALGRPIEIAAMILPFSSPFAMMSRAAQQASLLPHLLALPWQLLWVAIAVRTGSALFRRNVLKSGGGKKARAPL